MTYDKNRGLTDHMIFKYGQLWPDHPFKFRVPYQELAPTLPSELVEYRKTPSNIKSTVLTLLEGLDDEEMVYWCIDDKYPIELDVPRIEKMYQWLTEKESTEVDGLLFCRCRGLLGRKKLTGRKIRDQWKSTYFERSGYEQIWVHQFLKVKVLRHLFESFPDKIPNAKVMDELKKEVLKPESHRMFVSRQNRAVFGESASRGIITRNCYQSMLENNLTVPDWCSDAIGEEIVLGRLKSGWFRNNQAG